MGTNIESVQIIPEAHVQTLRESVNDNLMVDKPKVDHLPINDTDQTAPAFSKQPIKHFYIKKRRKDISKKQEEQSTLNHCSEKIGKFNTCRSKKRSFEQVSVQSLRRSARIKNKLKGCKNRSLVDSVGNKNLRASKKRKIAGLVELSGKIIRQPAIPEDFPGLADTENNASFPEMSTNMLQEVATSRCELSPLEVTSELLLASAEDQQTQTIGGSDNNGLIVTNE